MAIVALKKQKRHQSGLWIGLSIAAKQLPGGLIAVLLLAQKQIRVFLTACFVCFLVVLPFFVWDFQAFYENTFEFMLDRPARITSIAYYFHEVFSKFFALVVIFVLLFLNYFMSLRVKEKINDYQMGIVFFSLLVFIVFGKMTPINYFIWTAPFTIIFFLDRESRV